jgi:hypothetical protein
VRTDRAGWGCGGLLVHWQGRPEWADDLLQEIHQAVRADHARLLDEVGHRIREELAAFSERQTAANTGAVTAAVRQAAAATVAAHGEASAATGITNVRFFFRGGGGGGHAGCFRH